MFKSVGGEQIRLDKKHRINIECGGQGVFASGKQNSPEYLAHFFFIYLDFASCYLQYMTHYTNRSQLDLASSLKLQHANMPACCQRSTACYFSPLGLQRRSIRPSFSLSDPLDTLFSIRNHLELLIINEIILSWVQF